MTQIRLLTAADGLMTEAQSLTPEQQARTRENIKAAKHDALVVEALTDLDRVDLEDGEYSVTGSNDGLLKVANQEDTVLQLFESSVSTRRRRIIKADPQTYPEWTIAEGGVSGGIVSDISVLPDENNLRGFWSSKAPGNHNHDGVYLKPVTLLSITTEPDIFDIGDKYYNSAQKRIWSVVLIGLEMSFGEYATPSAGVVYKFDNLIYKWNGSDLVLIGDGGSIDPVIESITRPTRSNVNFIFEGNSRTADTRFDVYPHDPIYADGFPSYPQQLMLLSNFKNRGNYYNQARWGANNAYILAESRYNTNIKPHRPEANGGEAGITEAYIFIMSGILDTYNSNETAIDTQITAYKAYCDRAKADGFKVVVLAEFYGKYQTYNDNGEKARLKYNKAMMDYAKDGKIFMYIDTDHLVGTNLTDTFHFDTDFHLSWRGKKLIADYVNSRFDVANNNVTDSQLPYVTLPDLYTKVDKVAGKQLSTNDYTTTDKSLLYDLNTAIGYINTILDNINGEVI